MKALEIIIFSSIFYFLFLSSCYDDKGNYQYNWVDEVEIDTIRDTTIKARTILFLKPKVTYNVYDINRDSVQEKVLIDTSEFTYKWTAIPSDTLVRYVISEKFNLNEEINLKRGSYRLEFEVTDKSSGVTAQQSSSLYVETNTYASGFLFLTENDEGITDLEIYGTTPDGDKVLEKGILDRTNFPFTTGGANFVIYQKFNLSPRIWIGTGSGTGWLDEGTFDWVEDYIVEKIGINPPSVYSTVKKIGYNASNMCLYFFFTEDGEARYINNSAVLSVNMSKLNISNYLNIAPMVGGTQNAAILHDRNNLRMLGFSCFRGGSTTPDTELHTLSEEASAYNMELLYLLDEPTVAIFRDRSTGKYWRYTYGQELRDIGVSSKYTFFVKSKEELLGTENMGAINHFVVQRGRQFVYCAIGNKIYNYRETLNQWLEVNIEGENFTSLDNISFFHCERFQNEHDNYIFTVTYNEQTGESKMYAFEVDGNESRNLTVKLQIEGLGNVKHMSYFGY